MARNGKESLSIFALLLAFGVLGRLFQPEWNVTPIVAVAIFAGYFFRSLALAWLAPLGVLAISNLFLPAYNGISVMAVVYGMFLLPAVLGRWLRGRESYLRLAICGLAPATLFFLTTNLAVWTSSGLYERSLAGLVHCYVAAIPFYRSMVTGDVFFLAVVFGSYALATQFSWLRERQLAPVRVSR